MPSLFRRRMRYTRLSRPGSNHSSSGPQKMTQLFSWLVRTPKKGENNSRISLLDFQCLSPHVYNQLKLPFPHRRPNSLTLVRMYDNKVLDMLEVGIRDFKLMQDFKVRRSLLAAPVTPTPFPTDTKINAGPQTPYALRLSPIRYPPALYPTKTAPHRAL